MTIVDLYVTVERSVVIFNTMEKLVYVVDVPSAGEVLGQHNIGMQIVSSASLLRNPLSLIILLIFF